MSYSTDFTFYCKLYREPGTTKIQDINKCIQNMFNLPSYYQCIDNIKFSTKNNCAFVKVIREIEEKIEKRDPYTELYRDSNNTNIIIYPYYSINQLNEYKSPNKKDDLYLSTKRYFNNTEKLETKKQCLEIDVFESNNNYIDIKPLNENEIKIQFRRSLYEEIEKLDTELNISKINAEELKISYENILNEISKLEEIKQNKINEITKLF